MAAAPMATRRATGAARFTILRMSAPWLPVQGQEDVHPRLRGGARPPRGGVDAPLLPCPSGTWGWTEPCSRSCGKAEHGPARPVLRDRRAEEGVRPPPHVG